MTLVRLILALLAAPLLLLLFHTLMRVVRRSHKFPMPGIVADLIDNPHYPWARTLVEWEAAGFRLRTKLGSFFYHTLILEKGP